MSVSLPCGGLKIRIFIGVEVLVEAVNLVGSRNCGAVSGELKSLGLSSGLKCRSRTKFRD